MPMSHDQVFDALLSFIGKRCICLGHVAETRCTALLGRVFRVQHSHRRYGVAERLIGVPVSRA